MLITHLQQGTNVNLGLDNLPVVTGSGIAVFRVDNKSPHQFYSKGVPFEPVFTDCTPALDEYNAGTLHLVGTSHSGVAWDIRIDHNKSDANHAWMRDGVQCLNLRHKLIEDLLLGRPFAEVIAEFENERFNTAFVALQDQVARLLQEETFALKAKETLAEVFTVNEQGGRGSRVDVRSAILQLMPELASMVTSH